MDESEKKQKGNRYSRNPIGKPPRITEIDIARFQFLNTHGDLTAPYLNLYTKHTGLANGDYQSTYKRMGKLYDWGWVDRDENQYKNTRNTDRNYSVYRLNEKSKRFLIDAGLFAENTPRPSNSWKHDFQRACYTATVHLSCLMSADHEFIPHHEIVSRIGKDVFAAGTDEFIPDALCGIKYLQSGGARIFMVEIDCGSEQGESTAKSKKYRKVTIEDKLSVYRQYYRNKQQLTDFNISSVLVAVVTVNADRKQNLLNLALKIKPAGANYLLFTDVPGFGKFLYPPNELLPVFDIPYLRPGHDPFRMDVP